MSADSTWPHETPPGRCVHWPRTCAEVQAATPTWFKPCAHCWPAGWGLSIEADLRAKVRQERDAELRERFEALIARAERKGRYAEVLDLRATRVELFEENSDG